MQRPERDDARMETGRQEGTADVGNVKADRATLATKADRIAATIPYLLTREAKRSAVREFLATWVQILRGNPWCGV